MNQAVMVAVDWKQLLPLIGELAQMFLSNNINWARVVEIAIEVFNMFTAAEEVAGQAIDWSSLIKYLLTLLQQFMGTPDPAK